MYIKCTTTFHLKTSVPMHWGLGPLRLAPVELGFQKPSRITLLWPTHQHECWRKHLYSASSFSPRSRELPQSLGMTPRVTFQSSVAGIQGTNNQQCNMGSSCVIVHIAIYSNSIPHLRCSVRFISILSWSQSLKQPKWQSNHTQVIIVPRRKYLVE